MKVSVLLFLIWLVMAGIEKWSYVVMGAIVSMIISYFTFRSMDIPDTKGEKYYFMLDVNPFKLLMYIVWLLEEIIKSSAAVAIEVLRPKMKIQPQIIQFQCKYENPMATTLLINSIILTPGTITLDVDEEGIYTIHGLTEKAKETILKGTMQREIGKLYGEKGEVREVCS